MTKALFFIFTFLLASPIMSLLGIRSMFIVLGGIYFILVFKRMNIKIIFFVLLIILTSTISALYWNDSTLIFYPLSLIFSILLVQTLTINDFEKITDIASIFIFIILIGAIVSFVLAFIGTSPLATLKTYDGRPWYLYYTSFTNSIFRNIIRPSGIYDEPGALSFFTCSIVTFRHLLNRKMTFSWLILLLGFITLSIAHTIFVFIFILSFKFNLKNSMVFILVTLIFILIVFQSGFIDFIEKAYFYRFQLTDDGFAGDNRSFRFLNAFDLIANNPQSILFGINSNLLYKYGEFKDLYPPFGENPLTLLVTGGFLISWPYYVFILGSILIPIMMRKYFILLGMLLLFLQRPNFFLISYSAIGVSVFAIIIKIENQKKQVLERTTFKQQLKPIPLSESK